MKGKNMAKKQGFPLIGILILIGMGIAAAICGIFKLYKKYKLNKETNVERYRYSKMLDKKHYLHSIEYYEFERKVYIKLPYIKFGGKYV